MFTRRQYLMAIGTTATIGLAGCSEDSQGSDEETEPPRAVGSGDEASTQVTNRLNEVNTVGTIENGKITEVNITMELAPGSSDIDLDGVTIQWITTNRTANLIANTSDTTNADGIFSYTPLKDNDSSISEEGVLNSDGDRVTITIRLDGSQDRSLNAPLEPGQTVQAVVGTQSGAETTLTLVVPDTLSGNDSAEL